MDAINTARRQRIVATVAVVFAFACAVPAARAAALAPATAAVGPAATRSLVKTIERAADGKRRGDNSPDDTIDVSATAEARRAAILAALLLIPPPVDLITELPSTTPVATTTVVSGGPDLSIPSSPGGTDTKVLNTQATPEPASLVLGVFGSGLVAAGAWYRRRRAQRQAKEAEAEAEAETEPS
jgi:PEP-CTERM motif-containing protein